MPDIIGIDHIYITVSDMQISEKFYDTLMTVLGFRKNGFEIDAESHIQYYNRHFGYVLRPARSAGAHDAYLPGLHHLCFRVEREADVSEAAMKLREQGVSVKGPRLYPEYAPDYVAVFITDPDGLQLEITNYRQERRQRHDNWNDLDG